jgi:hypothetical protein
MVPEEKCDPNLFNVEADPFEENNLARNPEYAPVIKEMYGRLREWLKSTDPATYSTL